MKTQAKLNYSETKDTITVSLRKPTLRYLSDFIRLTCAGDLINKDLFPNAKEITESMGAYQAVRRTVWDIFQPHDESVKCIIVGDGHVPRTGALFAFRSAWNVISVDPAMYRTKIDYGHSIYGPQGINRLTAIRSRIEDLSFNLKGKVLIVCVHSHARLSDCAKVFKDNDKYIVNLPCCVQPDLGIDPDVEYEDWAIHSEKRLVQVYKNLIS